MKLHTILALLILMGGAFAQSEQPSGHTPIISGKTIFWSSMLFSAGAGSYDVYQTWSGIGTHRNSSGTGYYTIEEGGWSTAFCSSMDASCNAVANAELIG